MSMSRIEDLRTHPDKFVTAKELAEYYRVSDRTIRRLVDKGALEGVKIGRAVRIPTVAARDLGPLPD
jgi:excisionase family DNA binding protein